MFAIVHHPDYRIGRQRSGVFPWDKYGAIMDILRAGPSPPFEFAPPLMEREWLAAVHDPDYVDEVFAAEVPPEKARRIGFPVTEGLARRARRTVAGTWMAARIALQCGYAANSAGGSHHALYETGAGYCIFNDLAVAAHRLLEEGMVRHVLIVDLDVHQGDGTASLLAGRSDVVTFSMHADRNFPVRKALSTLDVPLPDGTGDDAYLDLLEQHLPILIADHRPDIILYQAGVDAHGEDRLGRLALTDAGLNARDALVASLARAHGIPLASALGGGYGGDHRAVARRHAEAMQVMALSYLG
jgi:acetoin utilization deacetylase AcuC-like enzyme